MTMTRHGAGGSVSRSLAAERLGVASVIFFVMSAATPLTVVAGVVTTGFAVTGLIGIPVAFVAVGAVLWLFSVGFVAMAPQVANAGAFYAYVSRGIGRPAGVAASWVALLAYNALQVGLYGAIGAAAAPLLADWFAVDVPWWVVALVAWALVAMLGLRHIDVSGKVLAVLLIAEVAVILVYSVSNLLHPAHDVVTFDSLAPANLVGPGSGAILALAVLGFVGFESAVVFSEETREPGRTVRIATYTSVGLIAALYTFGSWALSVATGPERIVTDSRSQSADLLFNLATVHLGPEVVVLGRVLFVTSIFAAMISFHNTTARYMFALGREQVLPAVLGRTSRRTGSPLLASSLQSAIGFMVIVLYAVAGWDPMVHLFYWLGTSGGLGVLVLLTTTSVAVLVFFARNANDEGTWRRRVAPLLATLAVLGITVLALMNFPTLLGVEPDAPVGWVVPMIYLLTAALGVVWGLVLRALHPRVYAAIGRGTAATSAGTGLGAYATEPKGSDSVITMDRRAP